MITVIVDTTATFIDVMMKGTRWMQLLTLCADSKVRLVVPDVVLRETARHWEKQAIEAIQIANQRAESISKSRERLDHLELDSSELSEVPNVTTTADQTQFLESLRDKLVSLGVDVRTVPKHVDIETILQRDLDRKKPFHKTGKGFRDALVWETTKEVVLESEAGETIYLVTDNRSDYCDDTGNIAPELIAEVESAVGTLIRVKDIDALLTDSNLHPLVAGLAKTDEDLAQFLSTVSDPDDPNAEPLPVGQVVKNAVLGALDYLTGDEVETANAATSGHDFSELNIPSELEVLTIFSVTPDELTLSWQTYETYQDTTFLIQAEIEAEVCLEGFAYKHDAIRLEEEGSIHIHDWDWNDHMAQVSTNVSTRLTFQIRLDQGMDFADECELEGVEQVGGPDEDHPWNQPS